jgi:hypothetical protein
MKINQRTGESAARHNKASINKALAITTSKALLVPYEAHHVLTYHAWMQDPVGLPSEESQCRKLTLCAVGHSASDRVRAVDAR